MKKPEDRFHFISAVKNNDFEKLTDYMHKGMDINSLDEDGKTGILISTEQNNIEMVRWLADRGADIDFRDQTKKIIDNTPFLYAGAKGLDDILDILIPLNPDVNILNGYGGNALIPACERGHVSTVKKLLERTKVDVNLINNLGWTALLEAIILGEGGKKHQEIVRLLLNHGANLNIADKDGVLPITHAQNKNYSEIYRILQSHQIN
ncbi:MAG: ankyrin repeat domain-containing protein [Candidatus Heimdallarchaeota archaeon]|nr:ankyrin repeat domain-containing protein [Candidatus Heimdallarchaeota archaeon]